MGEVDVAHETIPHDLPVDALAQAMNAMLNPVRPGPLHVYKAASVTVQIMSCATEAGPADQHLSEEEDRAVREGDDNHGHDTALSNFTPFSTGTRVVK
jgi:hypothetical protein